MRGRRHTDEHKAKIAAGNTGKKLSPAHIETLRSVNKNRVYSPETLMRMSAGQKGRKHSEESNMKRRQTMLLKREAQSERQRNNWLDPEYRERIKARMTAVRKK
jgi:monoamine oxidase